MNPFPIILSAPSGAGKTSIAHWVLDHRADVGQTISATTRPRRAHEVEGKHYHFLSDAEFASRRDAGEFAECAEVHGRWYGTLRSEVDRVLGSGKHAILAIDVQGARAFKGAFASSVLVFVLPPSVSVLVSRLKARNTESEDLIDRRLRTALREIDAVTDYDYVVINDVLEVAATQVSAIIDAEMARTARATAIDERVGALVAELRRELLATV